MVWKHVAVVGSARGIGLEFVNQLCVDKSTTVYALDKDETEEIKQIVDSHENVHFHRVDITEAGADALKAAAKSIPQIDLLLCIAGTVASMSPFLNRTEVDSPVVDELYRLFTINVIGTWNTIEALESKIVSGGKIMLMSSSFGSMERTTHTKAPTYSITKASVNMMGRKLALELAPRNIDVVLMTPGAVKTAIGGPWADVEPEDSVRGMLKELEREGTSGQFLRFDGEGCPW